MKIMSRAESPSIKKSIVRSAIKATAKHSAHGTASKVRRQPARAVTLLGLGCLLGGIAGWALGRAAA
jgi:hypothetical protein